MRAVVTTLVRRAGLAEPSGFVRVVDLDRREVLATMPVPESAARASDPNPRGGLRGAKGVSAFGGRLVLANAERLFVLGTDWTIENEIQHPWLGGIHDVLAEEQGIWVTCTACDLLACAGWDGGLTRTWSWRADEELAGDLGLPPPAPFDGSLDHRDPLTAHTGSHNLVHLNAVARTPDGLVVSLGRIASSRSAGRREARAALARGAARIGAGRAAVAGVRALRGAGLRARRSATDSLPDSTAALVLVRADGAAEALHRMTGRNSPNHNVLHDEGLLLFNDSDGACLSAFDPEEPGLVATVPIPGSPPFPRGLARLGNGRYLVGSQAPAALHTVDLEAGRVVSTLELGGRAAETVYAVELLPDGFDDPPAMRGTLAVELRR